MIGIKIDFKYKLNLEHTFNLDEQKGMTIELSKDEKSILIIGNKTSFIKGESRFVSILKHNTENEIISLDSPLLSNNNGSVYELNANNIEIVSDHYDLPSNLKIFDVLIKHEANQTFLYTSKKITKLDLLFKSSIDLHKSLIGSQNKEWNIVYNYSKKTIYLNTTDKDNFIPLNKWNKILIQNYDNVFYDIININDDENISFRILTENDSNFFFLKN